MPVLFSFHLTPGYRCSRFPQYSCFRLPAFVTRLVCRSERMSAEDSDVIKRVWEGKLPICFVLAQEDLSNQDRVPSPVYVSRYAGLFLSFIQYETCCSLHESVSYVLVTIDHLCTFTVV